MHVNTMTTTHQRQHGFTLIEILIAVFVLGVGLLGVAGLQANSLSNVNRNYEQTVAIGLAYEIADMMRANKQRANAGDFLLEPLDMPAEPSTDCANTGCSANQLSAYDLYEWHRQLTNELPSGTAQIICNGVCEAGAMMTVRVMWDQFRTGATDSSCFSAEEFAVLSITEQERRETYLSCVQINLTL